MGYPFAKDISYTFYPLANEAAIALPAQTATLYLYTTESKPSRSEVVSGASADASYSSTAVSLNDTSIAFTITAIQDPDQNSEKAKYTYWIVIKFLLKTSGTHQYELRALEMERATGHHTSITVTSTDLISVYPYATTYAGSTEITNFTTISKDEIQAHLRNAGYEWAQIWRPDRLKNAVVHLVLSKIMVSQIQRQGDHFTTLAGSFFEAYKGFRDSLKFEYDQYNTKQSTTTNTKQDVIFIKR